MSCVYSSELWLLEKLLPPHSQYVVNQYVISLYIHTHCIFNYFNIESFLLYNNINVLSQKIQRKKCQRGPCKNMWVFGFFLFCLRPHRLTVNPLWSVKEMRHIFACARCWRQLNGDFKPVPEQWNNSCRQRLACVLEVSIRARLSGMLSDDLIVTLNAMTCEQAIACRLLYRNCLWMCSQHECQVN